MVKISRRARQNRPKRKPRQQPARWGRWWKKGTKFTVEYIEYAVTLKKGGKLVWLYKTKWFLYARSQNTLETAWSFAECEFPIVEWFWKSVGVSLSEGHEPPIGPIGRRYYSTQAYRDEEAAETLRLALKDDEDEGTDEDGEMETISGQEESPEPNFDHEGGLEIHHQEAPHTDEVGCAMDEATTDSEDEVEALMLTDAFDHCTVKAPEDDPITALPLETYLTLQSPVSSQKLAQVLYDNWQGVFDGMPGASGVFRKAAPRDTIKKRKRPSNPSKTPRAARQASSSRPSGKKYSALRPRDGCTSSVAIDRDFESMLNISLCDKETSVVQWQTSSSRGTTGRRIAFITEPYTKPVRENILNHLHQLPPGMAYYGELADLTPAPEQANPLNPDDENDEASAMFEQFVDPANMYTLKNFPCNPDNNPMGSIF